MSTTLALDDELLAEARRLTGTTDETALVRKALTALIERESARRLARHGAAEPAAAETHGDVVSAPWSWSTGRVGYIDAPAVTGLTEAARLWTLDRRLATAAERLGAGCVADVSCLVFCPLLDLRILYVYTFVLRFGHDSQAP